MVLKQLSTTLTTVLLLFRLSAILKGITIAACGRGFHETPEQQEARCMCSARSAMVVQLLDVHKTNAGVPGRRAKIQSILIECPATHVGSLRMVYIPLYPLLAPNSLHHTF